MAGRRLLHSLLGALLAAAPASAQSKTLRIIQAALHQFEGGPPLPASHEFLPGEYVWVSFNVDGYKISPQESISLRYEIDAVDADGLKYVETKRDSIEAKLAVEDKEWKPKVHYDFLLPPLALTNTGHVHIRVHDVVGDTRAEHRIPLHVRGPGLRPTDRLEIQQFHFYRSEADTIPLETPAYRPGGALWARFAITGYRLGEGNRFHVWYGIEVLRADGSSLYAEPKAAEQQEESFYPKRYMQGALSLNLTRDLAAGEYTLIVRARDEVGAQEGEASRKFLVE